MPKTQDEKIKDNEDRTKKLEDKFDKLKLIATEGLTKIEPTSEWSVHKSLIKLYKAILEIN